MKPVEQDFLKKDEEAFEWIYERYFRLLEYVADRILEDEVESKDVAQESFLKAFMNVDSYKEDVSFLSWLCAIARNEALDRKRKRRWTNLDEEEMKKLPSKEEGPKEKARNQEILDRMAEILDKEDYDLVVYRVVFQLPYKEIGKLLDRPVSVLIPRYDRAIKKLRKELGGKI